MACHIIGHGPGLHSDCRPMRVMIPKDRPMHACVSLTLCSNILHEWKEAARMLMTIWSCLSILKRYCAKLFMHATLVPASCC